MGDGASLAGAQLSDLLKHFEPIVTGKIRALGIGRDDACWDDAYSDGMEGLWRGIVAFDPSRGVLEAYLCLRVMWKIRDGIRSREHVRAGTVIRVCSLEEWVGNEREIPDGMDLEAEVVDRDLLRRIAASDPRLPTVMAMRAEGATFDQAAAKVGTTRPAIRRALRRAREAAA